MKSAMLLCAALPCRGAAAEPAAAHSGGAPATVEAATLRRLARGDVLVEARDVAGSDIPEATVRAVIDAPPERIWAIVSDCENYDRNFTRTPRSTQLETRDGHIICEVLLDVPFPMSDLNAVTDAVQSEGPPVWERRWTLVRGDYKRNVGRWVVEPFGPDGRRTLLTFQAHVEPKTWVPDWIIRWAQRSALPRLMEALRELVAENREVVSRPAAAR